MNENFVTAAIQEDRYLKAIRLIDRFETEIRSELERAGDSIMEENPELFPDRVEPDWNNIQSASSVIAFARVDYEMARARFEDDPTPLTLNVSIRWLDPVEYGHHDEEGALCVACYKVKEAPDEDQERVTEQTSSEEWPIHISDDAFNNAPGVFYIPVENAAELRDAYETLGRHFSKYGAELGVEVSDR